MKPTTSVPNTRRKLSCEQIEDIYSLKSTASPSKKPNQFAKKSAAVPTKKKSNKSSLSTLCIQGKNNFGTSLKGLLSPVDHKLIQMQQKIASLKFDEENSKPLTKKSARRAKESPLIQEYQDQFQDLLPKSSKHKKKSSLDMNADCDLEDNVLMKKKGITSDGIYSAELRNKPYMKDVEYMVNPMFSPVNGPPKVRTKSQSHVNDADSTQFTNLSKLLILFFL